jgi:coenzyme F420-reducing hydrogenase beta subunit
MLAYIQNREDKKCCGCRACEQICPKRAIPMQKNAEGFLYPVLDEATCIKCGLCENACPMMNRPAGERIRAVYAVQHKEEYILKDSSSGGVFRLLADEVIRDGGYVVGCVWNEEYQPVLRIAHSLEELTLMQGSKYVSSDTNTVFSQAKRLLDANESVLFTGTPCQCAGLIGFLHKPMISY